MRQDKAKKRQKAKQDKQEQKKSGAQKLKELLDKDMSGKMFGDMDYPTNERILDMLK